MLNLYNNLPSIDLHGLDRDYSRILINDFIRDNYKMKNYKVIIIHGNGTGILKTFPTIGAHVDLKQPIIKKTIPKSRIFL